MLNIAVIGAGNIGARHVQSILSNMDSLLTIVDPSEKVKNNVGSIIGIDNLKKIEWISELSQIKSIPDIAIVATDAKPRKDIVLNLLDMGVKKFLLEKIVCQSTSQYKELLDAVEYNSAKAWVNFPRRYSPIYHQLKKLFKSDKEPIRMLVDAGNLGIACGAIHLIDLFQFICGTKNLFLDKECLKLKIIQTKRKDYIDFAGNLIIHSDNNSTLYLNFTDDDFWPLVEVYRNTTRYCIVDGDHKLSKMALKKNHWQWEEIEPVVSPVYVSQISHQVIKDIKNNNDCNMPTLHEAYQIHKLLLDTLLNNYRENVDKVANLVPVT